MWNATRPGVPELFSAAFECKPRKILPRARFGGVASPFSTYFSTHLLKSRDASPSHRIFERRLRRVPHNLFEIFAQRRAQAARIHRGRREVVGQRLSGHGGDTQRIKNTEQESNGSLAPRPQDRCVRQPRAFF